MLDSRPLRPPSERHDEAEIIEIDTEAMQISVDSSGVQIAIPYHGLGDEDYDETSATRKFGATSGIVREMAEEDEPREAPPRWMF